MAARFLAQSCAKLGVGRCNPGGGALKPIAIGIFAKRNEDFANRALDARKIELRPFAILVAHDRSPSRSRRIDTPAAPKTPPLRGACGLRMLTRTALTCGSFARSCRAIDSATDSISFFGSPST